MVLARAIHLLAHPNIIKYLKSGLSEPAEVRKYTEEYQSESDFFIQFINEKIVELDDSDAQLRNLLRTPSALVQANQGCGCKVSVL